MIHYDSRSTRALEAHPAHTLCVYKLMPLEGQGGANFSPLERTNPPRSAKALRKLELELTRFRGLFTAMAGQISS